MQTKVTKLTGMNVRALREECADLCTTTATTATFDGAPLDAYEALRHRMADVKVRHGGVGHPHASLSAVLRKLRQQSLPHKAPSKPVHLPVFEGLMRDLFNAR